MSGVIWLIEAIVQILIIAIVARALVSWFRADPRHPLIQVLNAITEPILGPLRRIIPPMGTFDITPIVAIILLEVIGRVLVYALS